MMERQDTRGEVHGANIRSNTPGKSRSFDYDQEDNRKSHSSIEHSNKKIRYLHEYIACDDTGHDLSDSLLTQTIVKCLLLSIIFLSLLNFAPAILSKRLSELNIHTYFYGLVFAIPCVVPVLSIVVAVKLLNKCNGNAILLTGTIIMSLGFYTVATETIGFFLLGIALLGFSAPFAVLPLFPMMTSSVDKSNHNHEMVTNALSGLYNAALGVGAIIGPLIGANLYYYFGFFTTAYVLGNT